MTQHLKEKVKEMTGKEKLQEAVYGLKDNLSEMGSATREMAADKVEGIREDISDFYERGQKKVQGFEQKIESEIKRNPMRALAIAAGIGFLISWLRRK